MRTVEETALLLALLLKRSEQTRARISEATIRKVAGRRHLRGAFVNMLKDQLDVLGLSMSELDRDGYGLIRASILEGAPPVTAKKHIADVLAKLRQGKLDFDKVREELADDLGADQDNDEN